MWEVIRYSDACRETWNCFVATSRQGTFLFDRDYMDYHRSRFTDHSLLVYRKGRLFALLPGNVDHDVLWSHQGLTYGGLLTQDRATVADVCEVFEAINAYLRSQGFRRVVYKAVPWIYHRLPAEEDLYALIAICHARLTARHVSSTLSLPRLPFRESRMSGLRKAKRTGLTVGEHTDFALFWPILTDNLHRQYDARPVHTVEEMQSLHAKFPDRIRLFMAFQEERPLAGTVVFETPQVAHTQYISASPEGKAVGALDLLFDDLLHRRYAHVRYFDFGKSSNGDGRELNHSLIFQKEGFGGRAVCYDWYEYDL